MGLNHASTSVPVRERLLPPPLLEIELDVDVDTASDVNIDADAADSSEEGEGRTERINIIAPPKKKTRRMIRLRCWDSWYWEESILGMYSSINSYSYKCCE